MGGTEADEGQGVQHDWPVPTQGLSDARLQLWGVRGERRRGMGTHTTIDLRATELRSS